MHLFSDRQTGKGNHPGERGRVHAEGRERRPTRRGRQELQKRRGAPPKVEIKTGERLLKKRKNIFSETRGRRLGPRFFRPKTHLSRDFGGTKFISNFEFALLPSFLAEIVGKIPKKNPL